MELGVFTILFNDLPLSGVLPLLSGMGIHTIELGTGGYSKSKHIDAEELLGSDIKRMEFQDLLERSHFRISAFSTQGNPVHPDAAQAGHYRRDYINSVLLAEKLGVDTLLLLSGCPGGSPKDTTPNWITCPWPLEYGYALEYQWEDVLIPYWTEAAKFAGEHGITKLAFEPHPGFSIYNPYTLLKLRSRVGDCIGANLDPSHLFWQGIDPCAAAAALQGCIYHVHIKDCFLQADNIKVDGVLDPRPYRDSAARSWNFRSAGYGHSESVWRNFISSLIEAGYHQTLSIEYEDALITPVEGLARTVEFLSRFVIREQPKAGWWALRPEG